MAYPEPALSRAVGVSRLIALKRSVAICEGAEFEDLSNRPKFWNKQNKSTLQTTKQ